MPLLSLLHCHSCSQDSPGNTQLEESQTFACRLEPYKVSDDRIFPCTRCINKEPPGGDRAEPGLSPVRDETQVPHHLHGMPLHLSKKATSSHDPYTCTQTSLISVGLASLLCHQPANLDTRKTCPLPGSLLQGSVLKCAYLGDPGRHLCCPPALRELSDSPDSRPGSRYPPLDRRDITVAHIPH